MPIYIVSRVGWVSFCLLFVILAAPNVYAELESPSYRFDESNIGTGSINDSSSSSYQIESATGALGIGNSSSSSYQVEAGTKTTPDPTLTFAITSSSANFGIFSPSAASTATASFSVINYTSFGYIVQIEGAAPTNGNHTLPGMATTGVSQPGIEQFGINLVANTSPISFGSNLDNGQFGFGQVAGDYSTPNEFRYVNGETIALAPKTSGKTIYTISYVVNVASLTPGGTYTSGQTLIVVGTY